MTPEMSPALEVQGHANSSGNDALAKFFTESLDKRFHPAMMLMMTIMIKIRAQGNYEIIWEFFLNGTPPPFGDPTLKKWEIL